MTRAVWRVDADSYPAGSSMDEQIRFLLRYAVLAPSSHNAQPWEFAVGDGYVAVEGAEDRRLEEADPDGREHHMSLGCAVETLRVAAHRFGVATLVHTFDEGSPVAHVDLGPSCNPHRDVRLFDEITERYTDHRPFTHDPVPEEIVEEFRDHAASVDVTLRAVTHPRARESVADLQRRADRLQADSPEYRRELSYWIGTGALGASRLRARVGSAVVGHLDVGPVEGRRNAKLVAGAPLVGVLTTDGDSRSEQVAAGRAYQRIALAASAAGLATHPLSQILERPEERAELRSLLDLDGHPQHLFRVGAVEGRQEPTPRWPAPAVTRQAERREAE